jgi:hypothetical protein
MPTDTTYQGWTNRATWGVALWLDNDEGLYHERRSIVKDHVDDVHACADALEMWVNDMAPNLGATLWSDLLSWSLASVNWRELAESWIEEEKENE